MKPSSLCRRIGAITRRGPGKKLTRKHEASLVPLSNHGAVRQMPPILQRAARRAALLVEHEVHFLGSRGMSPTIAPPESLAKPDRIRIPAFEARTVSRRKCRRLVKEKQLGVAGPEDRSATPFEAEFTTNPSACGKSPVRKRLGVRIMETPSPVPEHGAALWDGNDLAERRDPVLQGHGACSIRGQSPRVQLALKSAGQGLTGRGPSPQDR